MIVEDYVREMQLLPHPEGGYYREIYRSKGIIPQPTGFSGERNFATGIYYLLAKGDFSAFHRIKSDESWHFYAGGTLLVHELSPQGYRCTRLGNHLPTGETFQHVVPANVWFASEPAPGTEFSLVGCTVSPGFDFKDFELASKEELLEQYVGHAELVSRLCR